MLFDFFRSRSDQIYFALIVLIAISLPWPMIAGNILVVILVVFMVISGNYKEKWMRLKSGFIPFLLCSFFFLLSLYGMILTSNTKAGMFLIEKRLSLLLIPFIVFSMPFFKSDQIARICSFFVYSCYASMFFCLAWASYKFLILYSNGFINYNIFTIDLLAVVKISHVYYGMFLAFCLLIITELETGTSRRSLMLYWIQVTFLFLFMVLITAKMAVLASLFLIVLTYWKRYKTGLALKTSLIVFIIPLFIASVAMFYNPNIYSRLSSAIELAYSEIINDGLSYTSTRLGPMKCSLELIKRYGVLGFGTGDVQDAMNAWYRTHLLPELLDYESHSNYLNTILSFGLTGFIVLIFISIKQLRLANSGHYTLYLLFVGLISICSISENIFDLNKGILFYALFISILTSYSYQKQLNNDPE